MTFPRFAPGLAAALALALPLIAQTEPAEDDSASEAAALSQRLDGPTPEARARSFLEFAARARVKDELYPKHAMYTYTARLLLGTDTEYALAKFAEAAKATYEKSLAKTGANPSDAHAKDPFDKQALIHTWLLIRDQVKIPDETVRHLHDYVALWHHKVWTGYGALNYRLMMDGAGYIAAEQWPDLVDADGLNAAQIQTATKGRLMGYCDAIVHHGYSEHGSPTYAAVDLSALKMLADFARDPELKKHATLTLDWMLLDVACAWNQGYHVTPAGRAKYFGTSYTSPDAMDCTAGVGWLLFGAHRPVRGVGEIHSFWFVPEREYHLPAIIAGIALDRAQPVTHLATVRDGRDLRLTTYHTPTYSLASEWELIASPADGHYKESRRQMLKWVSDRGESTFIPMQENPRRPYKLSEHVANAFGYGENPFGQSLQHDGTLVGIINVPEDYPYYALYVPFVRTGAIVQRLERGGWIACHAGSMLFGFRPLKPWTWGKPRAKENCDVLCSPERKNGWILETAPLARYAGGGVQAELDRFAADLVQKTRVDASALDSDHPRFSYASLDGHLLEIAYRAHQEAYLDQHKIDGRPVNYAAFPLLGNPWVKQDLGGDVLTLSHAGKTLTYDFKRWTRTGDAN